MSLTLAAPGLARSIAPLFRIYVGRNCRPGYAPTLGKHAQRPNRQNAPVAVRPRGSRQLHQIVAALPKILRVVGIEGSPRQCGKRIDRGKRRLGLRIAGAGGDFGKPRKLREIAAELHGSKGRHPEVGRLGTFAQSRATHAIAQSHELFRFSIFGRRP